MIFPMATLDKLMCRRRLSSLLTNPFICFGSCWKLCRKNVKINNDGGSGKALTINHREYKSSTRQIGERFLTTFAKLKVVSPTAMAILAIYSAILETLVINREIFIPNREIGRLSLGGPNKAHVHFGKKCLQDSISQRLVQNLAHIWVNLLGIVRLQNIDLQLIIYWHRGHFVR